DCLSHADAPLGRDLRRQPRRLLLDPLRAERAGGARLLRECLEIVARRGREAAGGEDPGAVAGQRVAADLHRGAGRLEVAAGVEELGLEALPLERDPAHLAGIARRPGFGAAASWPQAASMSRPRVRRTVTGTRAFSSSHLNASISARDDGLEGSSPEAAAGGGRSACR